MAAPAASAAPGSAGDYLLDQFREFYAEVMRLREEALKTGRARGVGAKKAAAAKPAPPPEGVLRPLPPPLPGRAKPAVSEEDLATEEPPEAGEADDADLHSPMLKTEEALERLQAILEMQALEAGRRGGEYGVIYYKEAQYVMAALADEVFLHLDWPGRLAWKDDLLETRLFGTYAAGERFFQRLDKLLSGGDRVQAELAVVYLMALALGFRGKYRGAKHDRKLLEYRKQLYYYIYQRRPDLADQAHRLAPHAYDGVQREASPRMLPSPARWFWLLGLAILTYLIASDLLWRDAIQPLQDVLRRPG
jgi:type VI secretion system protein ImpK